MTVVRTFRRVRMTGLKKGDPKPVILKSGEPSIETCSLWWAICDTCGEGTWTNNFTKGKCLSCQRPDSKCAPTKGRPCCGECEHDLGLNCRMTPHCKGKHRKGDDE